MKALCIVSNREKNLRDFFRCWQECGDWDFVVLVEDNQTVQMHELDCPWPLHHFARGDMENDLGDDAWIISQGDTARVSYAFLKAAELGAEWLLKLDDDCLPIAPYAARLCEQHLRAMNRPRVQSTCDIRVRGLPYRNAGELRSRLNVGLWTDVPDLGAPEGLHPTPVYGATGGTFYQPPLGNQLAHPAARYPMCGMNLFFHASLLPAVYFGLQGKGWPYRRFDDIWAGWVFQQIAAHLGIAWSYGEPFIRHSRASDPFKNLVAEAPGIGLNETLWLRIDSIELTAVDVAGCAAQIGDDLATDSDPYVSKLGEALKVWTRLTADIQATIVPATSIRDGGGNRLLSASRNGCDPISAS
jgi:hypothetical protein